MAPKKVSAGVKNSTETSAVDVAPKVASAGAKRPAETAPAEEPASKRLAAVLKKHSVTQTLYKHVVEILEHPLAVNLSQSSREMLLSSLPYSLCVPSDERQEFQEATVKMMSQVMSQILSTMQASLDIENEKVAGSESKKRELEEKIQEAEAALSQAQGTTSAHQGELNLVSSALQGANAELSKAKDAQIAGDVAQAQAGTDKDALEAAVVGNLEKLKSGDMGDAAPETLYQSLEPLMLKLDLDTSLRTATKPALLNTPQGRGLFDNKVVEELEKSFAAKIEELTKAITDGQPASDARMALVTAAQDKVAEAEAAQNAAADVLASARAVQKEAQGSLKAAKASLTEYRPEFNKATEARDQQQEQVQTFMDANVASFDMLNTKISAKKKKAMAAAAAQSEAAAKAAAEAEESAKAAIEAESTVAQAAAAQEAAADEADAPVSNVPAPDGTNRAAVEAATEADTEMSVEDVPKVVEAATDPGTVAKLGA